MKSPFTILYITGRGHAGSTLLDLLISSHSEVTSVGELNLTPQNAGRNTECTCGAARISVCKFWLGVDSEIRRSTGITLDSIDVLSEDPGTFAVPYPWEVCARVEKAKYASNNSPQLVQVQEDEELRPVAVKLHGGTFVPVESIGDRREEEDPHNEWEDEPRVAMVYEVTMVGGEEIVLLRNMLRRLGTIWLGS